MFWRVLSRTIAGALLLGSGLILAVPAAANDLIGFINVGGGPQGESDQSHRSAGLDLNLYQYKRTPRQEISVGVGYTYLHANGAGNRVVHGVSIYPQLKLTPADKRPFQRYLPAGAEPYFLVRFLGPSYLSERQLGDRKQGRNFTFQAGVGVGFSVPQSNNRDLHFTLMWKHFSNANLYDDNDGIDVPVVVSFGMTL